MRSNAKTVGLATLLVLALTAACVRDPTIPYATAVAPQMLAPLPYANVTDARGDFRALYCAVQNHHGAAYGDDRPCAETKGTLAALHRVFKEPPAAPLGGLDLDRLPMTHRYVIVPGIFGECVKNEARPFEVAAQALTTRFRLSAQQFEWIDVSGRSSSELNARTIRDWVKKNATEKNKVVLIGYSKGISDILVALAQSETTAESDISRRVAAVVAVAGTVNGSVLPEALPDLLKTFARNVPYQPCPVGDKQGIRSLARSRRLNWLYDNRLPTGPKYYSVVAFAERERISSIMRPLFDITVRVNPHNDSQVIYYDAIVPGSALLAYVNADHWAVTLPFARKAPDKARLFGIDRNDFPREVLLESIIRFVERDLSKTR